MPRCSVYFLLLWISGEKLIRGVVYTKQHPWWPHLSFTAVHIKGLVAHMGWRIRLWRKGKRTRPARWSVGPVKSPYPGRPHINQPHVAKTWKEKGDCLSAAAYLWGSNTGAYVFLLPFVHPVVLPKKRCQQDHLSWCFCYVSDALWEFVSSC